MNYLSSHIAHPFLKHLVTLLLMVLCHASAGAQLFINGTPTVTDSLSNIILCSIPEQYFGKDFTATVQASDASGWRNITIDGKSIAQGVFTFESITGDKAFVINANRSGNLITKRLMFTFLPIFSIDGEMGYDYVNTHVTLIDPEGGVDTGMLAQVKWRGGYTNTDNRHKRNYNIKFIDANGEKQNRKLLGMRRDNHWKLDAAQVDLSRVRNRIATDLWLDMARPPYYIDQAPDALTGARGEMVEVFAGGNYMGIYSLMECIDRKQLQVKKYDEGTLNINGLIWLADHWSKVVEFKNWTSYSNDSPSYDNFVIKYPEFDEVNPTNHSYLFDATRFMTSCSVNSFNEQAHNYFDMPVIIDYTIFNQLLIAVDNSSNNIYWAIYDHNVDKRLTLAVWDLDWSLGTNRSSPDFRGGRAEPDFDYPIPNAVFFMLQDPQCIYYKDMVERYWQLRKSWLSVNSLTQRVAGLIDRLNRSGATSREEARWTGDSDINGLPLDINAEKDYIIDWIKKRIAFLDRTLMRHPCDVNADGAVTSSDLIAVYNFILYQGGYDEKLDTNLDGEVTASDITAIINFILGNDK